MRGDPHGEFGYPTPAGPLTGTRPRAHWEPG
jgi:hypothetical protein